MRFPLGPRAVFAQTAERRLPRRRRTPVPLNFSALSQEGYLLKKEFKPRDFYAFRVAKSASLRAEDATKPASGESPTGGCTYTARERRRLGVKLRLDRRRCELCAQRGFCI